ncbi:hypothetical protein EHQ58_12815 [Leptospira ognonensis]|uniref:Uncharacterized protein n=1 Tax=Leptospira ognonensis TaxID=2484945 RepID=A0A4R9JYC7_9LEPT|nr:hypothetical protein [Leptospira ognonensis]TGL58247.1 hypothetical protein EHQ58_12815 [Leptospira ognonensis]
MAEAISILSVSAENQNSVLESIRDRALGLRSFNYEPYSCFIEYKVKDRKTGVEYRDCIVDYTRCQNHNCIKKLV